MEHGTWNNFQTLQTRNPKLKEVFLNASASVHSYSIELVAATKPRPVQKIHEKLFNASRSTRFKPRIALKGHNLLAMGEAHQKNATSSPPSPVRAESEVKQIITDELERIKDDPELRNLLPKEK